LIHFAALKSGLTEAEAQDGVRKTIILVAGDLHTFRRDRTLGSFRSRLRNFISWRIADPLPKRIRARQGDTTETGAHAPLLNMA
jgi:hypothetical protein